MRKNLPVTDHEVVMHDNQVIISETDLKGIITQVDDDFVEISGFSREELIGKNHNIIRHPDMPPAAFQWLWDTIRAGEPWTGIVKNRCKNGDYYWVQANVTPIIKNGHVTGYVSVRTKPTRQQIEEADALYRAINAGKVTLGKQTLLQKLNFVSRMKIWQKIAATLLLTAALLSVSWFIALKGMQTSNDGVQMANNDRAVALAAADINSSILSMMVDLKKAQSILDKEAFDAAHVTITKEIADIEKLIDKIEHADLGDQERAAATSYIKATHDYVDHTIKPADKAMVAEDYGTFGTYVVNLNNEAFHAVEETALSFREVQDKTSKAEAAEAQADFLSIRNASTISVAISLLLALIFSVILIRSFSRRLRYTTEKLAQIAEGNYFDWVEIDNSDEIGKMLAGLKSMQIRQGYEMQLINERAEGALRIKTALDQVSGNVMMADENYNIIYMNKAVEQLMRNSSEELRKQLPDFDADKLIGSSIDIFHRDASHQRRILDGLTAPYESDDITIGNVTVKVIASPVFNEAGERIATVTEWIDRTAEVAAEQDVASIVEAVKAGDLTQRISLEGKTGFFVDLSKGLNELTDTIERGMDDIAKGLAALESGDLTYRITNEYQGTFDELKQANNNTAEKLADVVGNIIEAAAEVDGGSGEIAEGNNTLSNRTQEQAAALEETAASIEEITGTVQQTADNSRQANQLAVDAREQAENGGKVAEQAVAAMGNISASSRKISDIIGVIDEIAFQTNLLALNAAVEAARAGEQGRGFAVVAAEVRSLAQRSAEAAKEIKTLINQSVESVDAGSKLVDESGEALQAIVSSVAKVSDIIAEIAAASTEQTAGIDQINKAIAQLDSGTQQNTALVEESAAASQRLSDQANQLRQQVAIFKLGEQTSTPRAPRTARPAARPQAAPQPAPRPAPNPAPKARNNPPQPEGDVWEEF